MSRLSGLVLIDKPSGPTSHDVVAAVRRASGQRRVGHAGTLDPLAGGLLLVLLGSATRLAEYLTGHDKTYRVEARLGVETDTYDSQGVVTARSQDSLPEDDLIDRSLEAFRGELLQHPPPYSAVKVKGQPLYRAARRGETVAVPPRRITVHSLQWSRLSPDAIVLDVACSAGTYVRALVHDLGRALGCGAHVTALRRQRSGPFPVDSAVPLSDALQRLADGDTGLVLPAEAALPDWPKVELTREAVLSIQRGQATPGPAPEASGLHLVHVPGRGVVALARWDHEALVWRPKKVLDQENWV